MIPASLMLEDIREQPNALRRLVDDDSAVAAAAASINARAPSHLKIVAHGSSDNAGSFALYAFSIGAGIPMIRESLSLQIYYGAQRTLPDGVVIAVSQSGETPDVVAYVKSVAEHGTLTVAVTNEQRSELERAADMTIPILAGPERSLPATKTYMNQLATLFLLAAHLAGNEAAARAHLRTLADIVEETIETITPVAEELAATFISVGRMFVVARGVEWSTARETALKLTESCGVIATAMTSTDFCHGPVAAVDDSVPVWAVVADDATYLPAREAAERAVSAGGTLIVVGSRAKGIPGAYRTIVTPTAPEPLLSPLLSIIPAQLAAVALARAKGINPDLPTEVFRKVTRVA